MTLGGLWHGAALDVRRSGARITARSSRCTARCLGQAGSRGRSSRRCARAVTFLCVCLGWVLFRARSFSDAATVYARLFSPADGLSLPPQVLAVFAGLVAVVLAAHLWARFSDVDALARRLPVPVAAVAFALALLASQLLMPDEGGAFLYFQF